MLIKANKHDHRALINMATRPNGSVCAFLSRTNCYSTKHDHNLIFVPISISRSSSSSVRMSRSSIFGQVHLEAPLTMVVSADCKINIIHVRLPIVFLRILPNMFSLCCALRFLWKEAHVCSLNLSESARFGSAHNHSKDSGTPDYCIHGLHPTV